MSTQEREYQLAIQDFRHARRKASLEKIMAFIAGKSVELLSYEEVRQKLQLMRPSEYSFKKIPINAIVGSVRHYHDFTRSFLPTQDRDEMQWVSVDMLAATPEGLPPIEVFQIGEVYFVLDGEPCVSVAQQRGATHIDAHVNEIRTAIPLTPDIQLDDLIIKTEYAEFLQSTHLDQFRPGLNLTVTAPGSYRRLEEHIAVHRYVMEETQQRKISSAEAVINWCDTVYAPIERIIQERGILRDFPDRTATDLYLWICEHRAELERQLEWDVSSETAAVDLVKTVRQKSEHILSRIGEWLGDTLMLDKFESGPIPGEWRKEKMAMRRRDRLFSGILVAITGQENGWCALDQAIEIAKHEDGQIYGLHVAPSVIQKTSDAMQALRAEFEQRCRAANIRGKLAIERGNIARRICERARWTDLVVMHLAQPPGLQAISRITSGFRAIIQRCPRPILAVPKAATRMAHILLTYDGSPKAEEALYVSAYLAGRWDSSLMVVCVEEDHLTSETLSFARKYLDSRQINATFVQKFGEVNEILLKVIETYQNDLILIGGYGYNPVMEVVAGSTLDHVLRHAHQPLLICR